MKIVKYPENSEEISQILDTKEFDPNIDSYYDDLLFKQVNIFPELSNQFYYIYDYYKKRILYISEGFKRITGYDKMVKDFTFLYDLIHPADRLMIYKATMKAIYLADRHKGTGPFDYIFSMDYRIKKADGNYIRILRHTGITGNDKEGNMLFSFALYTDISDTKKSNKIRFKLHTKTPPRFQFSASEFHTDIDIFTSQEKKIIPLLAKGESSIHIAEKLFISRHTVDTNRRNMLKKTKLNNTAELVIYAKEHGII